MNPSRGALLKPSQGNGTSKLSAAKPARAIRSQSRYEVLKHSIKSWWDDRLKVGEYLREIRDGKLYKSEYKTFEEFSEAEFEIKRTYAHRLIEAVGVKDSLKMLPIGNKITTESQARALAPVPNEKREEVLTQVVEQGPVTAAAITAVAKEIKEAKAEPIVHLDKTNYPIPEEIYPDWERAEAFAEQLRAISQIKSLIAKGLETGDVIFRELNNDTVSTLKNVYGEMKCVIPYAVCSSCQGRSPKRCALCKGRGFLSRFAWDQFVPSKTKEMRERMSA